MKSVDLLQVTFDNIISRLRSGGDNFTFIAMHINRDMQKVQFTIEQTLNDVDLKNDLDKIKGKHE